MTFNAAINLMVPLNLFPSTRGDLPSSTSVRKLLSIQQFDNSLLINLLTTILPNGNTLAYQCLFFYLMILSFREVQKMFPYFRYGTNNKNISLYQLLLLSCVNLPHQCIHILLILTILSNIPPMIIPTVFHSNTLLLIQVSITIFRHLFLQHIH